MSKAITKEDIVRVSKEINTASKVISMTTMDFINETAKRFSQEGCNQQNVHRFLIDAVITELREEGERWKRERPN